MSITKFNIVNRCKTHYGNKLLWRWLCHVENSQMKRHCTKLNTAPATFDVHISTFTILKSFVLILKQYQNIQQVFAFTWNVCHKDPSHGLVRTGPWGSGRSARIPAMLLNTLFPHRKSSIIVTLSRAAISLILKVRFGHLSRYIHWTLNSDL